MDSFGTWRKWKLIFFILVDNKQYKTKVNAEFYRVVWISNTLLMLPFSGNNQQQQKFGVPPKSLP